MLPLTSEEGLKRAKALRVDLQSRQFDAVFCSDLKRAIDSTEVFFQGKFPVFHDWRLRECNYGDLDGTYANDFKKGREQEYIDTAYPGGESYKDVELRIASFLNDLNAHFSYRHVAIVAHQAPQLALNVLLRDLTWEDAITNDWRKAKSWQAGWEYEAI